MYFFIDELLALQNGSPLVNQSDSPEQIRTENSADDAEQVKMVDELAQQAAKTVNTHELMQMDSTSGTQGGQPGDNGTKQRETEKSDTG